MIGVLLAGSCVVLAPGAEPAPLDLAAPEPLVAAPAGASAVCERGSIVPEPRDDRVLRELRLPLVILSDGRRAVLELHGGQYVFGLTAGAASPEEGAAIGPRLDEFQARLQASD